jgi:hypothetical protein
MSGYFCAVDTEMALLYIKMLHHIRVALYGKNMSYRGGGLSNNAGGSPARTLV